MGGENENHGRGPMFPAAGIRVDTRGRGVCGAGCSACRHAFYGVHEGLRRRVVFLVIPHGFPSRRCHHRRRMVDCRTRTDAPPARTLGSSRTR